MAFCSSVTAEAALSSASCWSVWQTFRLRCNSHTWQEKKESFKSFEDKFGHFLGWLFFAHDVLQKRLQVVVSLASLDK